MTRPQWPQSGDGGAAGETFHRLHEALLRLRDGARSGESLEVSLAHWVEALEAAQALEKLAQESPDQVCADQLSFGLEELESAARQFFRDTESPDEERGRRCAVLRAVSRLMLRLARQYEHLEKRDETPFLIQELQEVENAFHAEQVVSEERDVRDNDAVEAARERLEELRILVMKGQAQQLLDAASSVRPCEGEGAFQVFRLSRSLSATAFVLRWHRPQGDQSGGPDEELDELAARITRASEELRQQFLTFLGRAESEEDVRSGMDALSWITGELDSGRIESWDDHSLERIEKLRALEEEGRVYAAGAADFVRAVDALPLEEELKDKCRRTRRRLRRMVKRLGHVIADRILARRLDRAFSPAQVRRWERFIFWLIMAVMVLIAIDHFSGPEMVEEALAHSDGAGHVAEEQSWREVMGHVWSGIGWTIWVDTIICVILLWDFLVRLLLSPARLAYFRRHFLTEFLPSVPFGLLQGVMAIDKLRFVRTARLIRVARFLRFTRPIIRLLRLFLFLARAADRLVERNSWFLNQNIVFSTEEEDDATAATLLSRARTMDSWIGNKTAPILADLPVAAQLAAANWRMGLIDVEHKFHDGGAAAAMERESHRGETVRDLQVSRVVETLRSLDDNQVAEMIGVDVARQLTDSLRFFRLPFLRRFAFARFLLGPSGAPDPLWTTARLGRFLGDLLDALARTVHWFGDLYGTITGAQFLDRIGMQLVKATIRPAKRLIILAVVTGFAFALVWLTQIPDLIDAARGLSSILGEFVLLLGLICFIPLGLGLWLRRIAGQAVDFFDRVSEAQFFALTEVSKEEHSEQDIAFLVDRVLMPEHCIRTESTDPADLNRARAALLAACRKDGEFDDSASPLPWSTCDAMMLYYRDFIDGAYFHRNDTKIANILIGNLTLENIRHNRLGFDARRFKRLERLDIARGRGGLVGPRVWFSFITHSVSQYTARLIIEYNQHCIPVDEYEAATSEDRKIFDSWLARRQRISQARQRNEVLTRDEFQAPDSTRGSLVYRTTEFNALNFLTRERKRDEAVRRRFGQAVADLLVEDRTILIRDIFGTFPLQDMPKEKRTINPYRIYQRYFARGRVFVFPFVAVWLVLKGMRLLMKRIVFIVKDVMNPNERPIKLSAGRSGFEVARRKIYRMRRPVVMEAVELRALFDLEYLGIAIPGLERECVRSEDLLVEDLRRLDASERDWEHFRELKTAREVRIRTLARFLRHREKAGHVFWDDLVARQNRMAGRRSEVLRAVATAFVCDHEDVFSILDGLQELSDLIQRLPEKESRWVRFARRSGTLQRVEALWPLIAPGGVARERARALAVTLDRSHRPMRRHLDVLEKALKESSDLQAHVYNILLQVGEKPSSWNEQMIAVRCVQSLGMLDLQGYERVIRELGCYEDEPKRSPVRGPRL